MKTKIEQMENIHHGGKDHYIITVGNKKYFESYGKLIAIVSNGKVTLNAYYWDYSKTTAAYRNRFLGVSNKECHKRVASGEYRVRELDSRILVDLHNA